MRPDPPRHIHFETLSVEAIYRLDDVKNHNVIPIAKGLPFKAISLFLTANPLISNLDLTTLLFVIKIFRVSRIHITFTNAYKHLCC